jgi:thioesterase domain-containing protein
MLWTCPPPLPETEIEQRIAEVSKHCIRALDSHRPKAFSGRIALIRATDLADWTEVADPSGTCGWGSICKGGVDVIPMACAHLEFFNEPHVTDVAGRINVLLNAIDR